MKTVLKGWVRSLSRRATVVTAAAMLLAALALGGPASAVVIPNPGSISIADKGQATPYPATVSVSGLSGTITDLNVSLKGVSHTFPDDIEALLVGPGGQKVILMANVGGGGDLNGVDLTFDDEAAGGLPDSAQITAGTYKPTGFGSISIATPAPAGPYGTSLTAFDGVDPNGTYSLYVVDDSKNDSGQISGGFTVEITTDSGPPPTASDLLPDLSMARLQNLSIKNCTQTNFRDCAYVGQKQLRFDTIIVNVGADRFEARGSRSTSSAPMTVTQRIYNDAGGFRDFPTTAQMYFAGDGHTHWHLRDLESYELIRLDNGSKVGAGAKEGFCFFDNVVFGSTQEAFYKGCGNNPDALNVTMGLSRGWGDLYGAGTVGQYIDITNLTSGRYKLQATADGANWFLESNDSNNFTWVEVQISGNSVSVIAYGPGAQPI
jgi:hypothetical protein